MKPKRPQKEETTITLAGNWVEVGDLVKPGEVKEIAQGLSVDRTGVVLDPPEPIKKSGKKNRGKK